MPHRRLINFDWALKRLLRSKDHFGILEGFLSELLRQDLQILETLERGNNKDTAIEKHNQVDLKARNTAGEIILIEVQYQRQFEFIAGCCGARAGLNRPSWRVKTGPTFLINQLVSFYTASHCGACPNGFYFGK